MVRIRKEEFIRELESQLKRAKLVVKGLEEKIKDLKENNGK